MPSESKRRRIENILEENGVLVDRGSAESLDAIIDLAQRTEVALFDFDGVIADTEAHQFAAYRDLLLEMGREITLQDFGAYMGHSEPEIYALMTRDYNLEIDVATAIERRRAIFLRRLEQVRLRPYPYIGELLPALAKLGIDMHVVSSNVEKVIDSLLRRWGVRGYFGEIATPTSRTPPVPKPILLADVVSELEAEPPRVLLFEDSARMIELARSLGMRTVAVRHGLNREAELGGDVEISPLVHPQAG
jgi:HAD superfamily hydrolase (TIGR01509 family)